MSNTCQSFGEEKWSEDSNFILQEDLAVCSTGGPPAKGGKGDTLEEGKGPPEVAATQEGIHQLVPATAGPTQGCSS